MNAFPSAATVAHLTDVQAAGRVLVLAAIAARTEQPRLRELARAITTHYDTHRAQGAPPGAALAAAIEATRPLAARLDWD
jgi:hypothetical protein